MSTVTGFDDVTLSLIPAKPRVVFAYPYGDFANLEQAHKDFPDAIIIPVCTSADDPIPAGYKIVYLDVERYDATVAQAAGWWRKARYAGIEFPGFYCSVSVAMQLIAMLAAAGITRAMFFLWTAHYDPSIGAHICHPGCYVGFEDTADLTQWTDTGDGRSLDVDLCMPAAVGIIVAPPDPHHYDWFFDQTWDIDGTLINERATVEAYDRERALQTHHDHPDRPELLVLRDHCSVLASRIETLMHEQLVNGRVDGNRYRRDWRAAQLKGRAAGRRMT